MTDTEKKPRKARTPRLILAPGVLPPEQTFQETRFASANPTSGDDLMAIWDLPPQASTQGRVKILKKDYASSLLTIVGECEVKDYSMAATASKWGPGEYLIQLSPSPAKLWNLRSSSIRVSPEYAQAEGWSPVSQRPAEVAPLRVSNLQTYEGVAAKDGPMTPVQVASLVETLLDRMEARRRPDPPPAQDMAAMFGMFSNFQRIQEQAEERARANMAVFAKMAAPAVGSEWAEVAREVLPSLVPVLGSIAGAIMQKNLPPPPPPPAIELDDLEDETTPEPQDQPMPTAQPVTIPLNMAERAYLAPAVGMFAPFIGHVLTIIRQKGPEEGALELANFIPGMMIPRIKKLCEWQREKGLSVMAAVNPAFMTPEAVALLEGIVKLAEGHHTSSSPTTPA